jgi:S-DNA-T family DNA segregation ATPase FtsK/SpoIIIE
MINGLFGWGAYIFPVALIVLGVWLIFRNFESIPKLAFERLLGFLLLFINLLVVLQLVYLTWFHTPEAIHIAIGGGSIGTWLSSFLYRGLGWFGLLILLAAWLLVGLALTLDRSILDLFRWIPPLWLRLQDAWDDINARLKERAAQRTATRSKNQPAPDPLASMTPVPTAYFPPIDSVGTFLPGVEETTRTWVLPDITRMLDAGIDVEFDDDFDRQRARVIEETLASFGAPAQVVEINRGPVITQFGVEPDFIENNKGRTRVRVSKITALADDLALVLAASSIRIQAPVPGRGYIGIEVPNETIADVALRDVIESPAFTRLNSPLRFALGQDVAGNAVAADLVGMPHLLIAGATGSGKSVCVNALIACLLLHNTPDTIRLIMVDPKRVELTGYNGIPHLLAPVVVEIDRIVGVLQWVTREMDSRYQKFADSGARNIIDYNQRMTQQGSKLLPYLVVIIDELADLMMVSPDQTERLITRMAQLARATGIHLVISTQRPSVDVVTGLIKANIPARISFATASGTDSRVILDSPGAERLLGRGDMLFQAPDSPTSVRLQGVYVSDSEIVRIVHYWRAMSGVTTPASTIASRPQPDALPRNIPLKQMEIWKEMQEKEPKDELYTESIAIVREEGRASISMLQRKLRIGYTRAARLIDAMENEGIIGPPRGAAHTREILDYGDYPPTKND